MTALDHIQETVSEIKARRARIAELGGHVEALFELDYPTSMAIEVFENIAKSLRAQQEELERVAMKRAGTYAQAG